MKQDHALGFALFLSFIMLLASMAVAWLTVRGEVSGLTDKALLLCFSVAGASSCALTLLSGLQKPLFEDRRISVWHMLLLPPMHVALMAMIVSLATTSAESIATVSEIGRLLFIWHQWSTLLTALIAQAFALGIAFLIQRLWHIRRAR